MAGNRLIYLLSAVPPGDHGRFGTVGTLRPPRLRFRVHDQKMTVAARQMALKKA
jgi:hypothetical protein